MAPKFAYFLDRTKKKAGSRLIKSRDCPKLVSGSDGLFLAVALSEFIDPTGGIDQYVLARIERV